MKTMKKVKEIARLKFSQTRYKIIKLTFSECFPIKSLPLKCLTEVIIHSQMYFTIVWECWFPSRCKFILRLYHMGIDQSKPAPRHRFQKYDK